MSLKKGDYNKNSNILDIALPEYLKSIYYQFEYQHVDQILPKEKIS